MIRTIFILLLPVQHDIIIIAVTPIPTGEGGCVMDMLYSFVVSVLASIVAHYICKYFDQDDEK